MAVLPISAKDSYNSDTSTHDIVDEAIALFRANILFKNFKVKGSADKSVIFLTCFIQKCMEQMARFKDQDRATNVVGQIVNDPKAVEVGMETFFMNKLGLLNIKAPVAEKRKLGDYLKKLMQECAKRLLEYLFRAGEGDLNRKYWVGMGKRPFLGQKFTDKQYSV